MEPIEWTWSDGWILMAVYLARNEGRGTSLGEMIGTADGINHAVPTSAEVSGALTKLIQASVIESADGRYRVKETHLEGLEQAHNRRGGLFESANKGKAWLNSAGLSASHEGGVSVTDEEIANAYRAFRKERSKRKK